MDHTHTCLPIFFTWFFYTYFPVVYMVYSGGMRTVTASDKGASGGHPEGATVASA